jgi:hypothetical protein
MLRLRGTTATVSVVEGLGKVGSKHWRRTKILMIHSSTVCSDSGSNEKMPIVRVSSQGNVRVEDCVITKGMSWCCRGQGR